MRLTDAQFTAKLESAANLNETLTLYERIYNSSPRAEEEWDRLRRIFEKALGLINTYSEACSLYKVCDLNDLVQANRIFDKMLAVVKTQQDLLDLYDCCGDASTVVFMRDFIRKMFDLADKLGIEKE